MKNKLMEYPHPVLYEGGKDFIDSSFSVTLIGQNDEDRNISFSFRYDIECEGIKGMINSGALKLVMKVSCPRTSYRCAERVLNFENAEISIPKEKVNDTLFLQALIVSSKDENEYILDEFNKKYFGDKVFILRKGDIVAYAPELIVKLDSVLEKNIPSIILVSTSSEIHELKVIYAKDDETNEKYQNYITIWLPEDEYLSYERLRKKKSFKVGVSRFLQAALIVPALTEGISKLRMEDSVLPEEGEPKYHGTIWADSICEALKELGIDDLSDCHYSDYELANRLLGNVEGDALDNLLRKMQDWSLLRQEDDIL